MDFELALNNITYFFTTTKYLLYKLGTLTILMYLFSVFLSGACSGTRTDIPMTILFFLVICGYLLHFSNNLINKNKEILPDVISDRSGIIMRGLQFSFILLCYLFPVYIVWINIVKNKPYISNNLHLGIITVSLTIFVIMGAVAATLFSKEFKFVNSFNIIKIVKIIKYAYKEYLFLFLILINFLIVTFIPMTPVLRVQIILMFFSLNVILDLIVLILLRSETVIEMIKRWSLMILVIFISLLYQRLVIGLLVNHLGFIMLTTITAPILLILQHLFYQAYMIGLNKLRENELS